MTQICHAILPVHKNIWHRRTGKGGRDLAIEITGKIVRLVISDTTDTDVELVANVQTEHGHNRIKLRKHDTKFECAAKCYLYLWTESTIERKRDFRFLQYWTDMCFLVFA